MTLCAKVTQLVKHMSKQTSIALKTVRCSSTYSDMNDQIKAVSAVQWWLSGLFPTRQMEEKQTNSLNLKSSDFTLIVSHQHVDSLTCSVLSRRLCRAQELAQMNSTLVQIPPAWMCPHGRPLPSPPPPLISSPHLTQTNRPVSPTWSLTLPSPS